MKKVLVVDDSKTILGALKAKFSKYPDIEVLYAETYKETMKILRGNYKDIGVALLDINLPDAPNGEVISLANSHNIPTIVLTGTVNQTIRETIQEKEISGYILKNKSSSIDLAVNSAITTLENSNKTILIVDDSKTQRKEISIILQNNNLNTIEASNGQEALDILNDGQNNVNLLITDYDMPVMNGLELIIKTRELYDKNELGILCISSMGSTKVITDIFTFGANDFIQKPLNAAEITAKVNLNLELLKLFQDMADIANKDFMTGAYNRRYFFESGNSIFLKNKRKKTPLAVAMIDIDKFKNINDTYGHDVGDVAIKEIKRVLDNNLRVSDLMARFGGEEFCIILEDITEEDTRKLFEKIRLAFEENVININEMTITYTVSFGIAFGILNTLEDMVKLSDDALYDSKENGRNQVTLKIT